MKKSEKILFVAACIVICLIPFVGMTVAPTNDTTENRKMVQLPAFIEGDTINKEYLEQLGLYFEDHFALRNMLVMADSVIQSKVFYVSNMDTVIAGKDGWLYYTATLSDYQGKQTLSERGVWNAVHNLSMTQHYVENHGATFLVTVAPNKNSLYSENMPYYYKNKVSNTKNMDLFDKALLESQISYVNLFELFEKQEETLYLKRDSHWNQKGAVLVYNAMMDFLMLEHDTYETVPNIRTKTEYGDLNKMLYPFCVFPEWNYAYQKEQDYSYMTDTQGVEDTWIETVNKEGKGSLLMFRDSFGNTLLPLMADTFKTAYFSKTVPYNLEQYMENYEPENVIIEKVERNIDDFAQEPPIITAFEVDVPGEIQTVTTKTTLEMKESEYNVDYWQIAGSMDEEYMSEDSPVYVKLTNGDYQKIYEAFTVSLEDSDWGYLLYLAKDEVLPGKMEVSVLTGTDKSLLQVQMGTFDTSLLDK
ncbi:MAG: hypothetical protein K2L07_14925 [Lachnospiraceae bacterium]|nr:hypothetical protein [Lachnospiraceae bacterium]